MLALKPGVSLANLQPQTLVAMIIVDGVYADHWEMYTTVTSVADYVYGRVSNSLHPRGLAFDVRLPNDGEIEAIVIACKERLTREYDVVLKPDHIHVEYDPK